MARDLEQLLQEEVRGAGFEIYDWSLKPAGRRGRLLLITIHSEQGVNLDDCAKVSRALGRALDEAGIIQDRYILEVSSPGMDRPLMSLRHYEIALGRLARVQLSEGGSGRILEGRILGIEEGAVILEQPEGSESVPFTAITKARLIPQFPGRQREPKGHTGGKK